MRRKLSEAQAWVWLARNVVYEERFCGPMTGISLLYNDGRITIHTRNDMIMHLALARGTRDYYQVAIDARQGVARKRARRASDMLFLDDFTDACICYALLAEDHS